jgi:signal peptide peptidase SppA
MSNFDLHLRRRGSMLLMERASAEALLIRMNERPQGSGLIQRAMRVVGFGDSFAAEDREQDNRKLATAPVAWADPNDQQMCEGYIRVGDIAVVDVKGALTPDGYFDWWECIYVGGYVGIGAAIRAARADHNVKGIMLRIDSPGGLVDGCFELCDEIRKFSAREGGKPVWASARMAYSAAYAIASACDRIVAPAAAGVGSIGVVILHLDQSDWLKEIGIKIEAIESGKHKTDGAWFKPLSEDARADMQSEVDEIAKIFVGCVTAGRGLTAAAVKAQEARCYLARHSDEKRSGLALGLVDAIAAEAECARQFAEFLKQPQNAAQPTEAAMAKKKLEAEISKIIAGAGTADEKAAAIAALKAKAVEDDEDEEKEGKSKSKKSGDDDKDNKDASEDEDKDKASSDDEDDDEDEEKDEASALAVLDLPEAAGRDGLAKSLAKLVASKKITVTDAKAQLAAAPKANRLGDVMHGRDKNPGADGTKPGTGAGLESAVTKMIAGMQPK